MHKEDFFTLLTQEYSIKLATTPQDFQAVKKIREEVYSQKFHLTSTFMEEKGYLFAEEDLQSFIYLLRHNDTDSYVGTVRLFFINKMTPLQKLPMQKDGGVQNIEHLTKNVPLIEVSRGALIQNLPTHTHYSALQLRTLLTYGLMIATRINFLLYHYTMVFSIMEPSLNRILKRQQVHFEQIGQPVNYYGIRIPYGIERKKLLQETEESMGEITRYYLKELCENPDAFWAFIDNNPYLERSEIHLDRICRLFKEHGEDVALSLLMGEDTPST